MNDNQTISSPPAFSTAIAKPGGGTSFVDKTAIGLACVDLISQLENDFASAHAGYRGDQVDESAATSKQMIERVVNFSETHLTDFINELAPSITAAIAAGHEHKQVVRGRSWAKTIVSVFVDKVESDAAQTHEKLGEATVLAFSTAFNIAIQILGAESPIGEQVQQSLDVFVEEFAQSW
jgi:hypothetical protein